MIYVMIFFLKILSVSLGTVRLVLMARGHRLFASLAAAAEISIWLYVTGTVLLGISEDPLKAVVYVLGVMVGIYLGLALEDKLAIGFSQIEIITTQSEASIITDTLRGEGYRITTYDCDGLEGKKTSLIMKVLRKDIPSTVERLKEYDHLFVTITDIRKVTVGSIARHTVMKQ